MHTPQNGKGYRLPTRAIRVGSPFLYRFCSVFVCMCERMRRIEVGEVVGCGGCAGDLIIGGVWYAKIECGGLGREGEGRGDLGNAPGMHYMILGT
jgi:hypothetical protein